MTHLMNVQKNKHTAYVILIAALEQEILGKERKKHNNTE